MVEHELAKKALTDQGGRNRMDSNVMWLGLLVVLALGAMVVQFIINVRNKRRTKHP